MSKGVAVIVEDASESEPVYLMLKQQRDEYETGIHYAPPAGTFDPKLDDQPEDTAVREIYEETGLNVEKDLLERLFVTGADHGVDKLIWYRVKKDLNSGDIQLNHESKDYSLMSKDSALDEKLLDDTRNALERL